MTGDFVPRTRAGLRYVRQVVEGKTSFVVKDPVRLTYFRFGEVEAWLMQRMDGTRSIGRLADELETELGVAISANGLEAFVRRLKELGLAERSNEEKRALLLEMLRRDRRLRLKGHGSTLLRMRFSLGDPDRLFQTLAEKLPFVWSPGFVALSIAAFLTYGLIITAQWDVFSRGVNSLYTLDFYSPAMLVTLWASLAVITAIHEVGHGVTCRHFGGEVHEMGAMLIYFMPAAYCNVNDAWTFETRAQRLWVTFAGGWIQLLVACLAALLWLLAEPATYLHQLAFVVMLIAGGLIIIINFNPLIPLDGYYALMDWLEIPNLRSRSFQYLGAHLKRSLLRLDVSIPNATPRERRVFLVYGILALIYTVSLLSGLALLAGSFVVEHFGGWGWFIVALVAARVAARLIGRSKRVFRVWWTEKVPPGRARRFVLRGALAALVLLGVGFLTPWVIRARGAAAVEPAQRLWLRAPDDAVVDSVLVREGQRVEAGGVVAMLRSPRADLDWANARAGVDVLERQAATHRARGRSADARFAELRLDYARERLRELERLRGRLVLRAPFNALVVTPHPEELAGAGVSRGDSVIELWSADSVRLRVLIAQRDAGGVREGAVLAARFPAAPGRTVHTRIAHVGAATQAGTVELLAPMPASALADAPAGSAGRAKVVVERTSVARAIARGIRRTIRVDWLL